MKRSFNPHRVTPQEHRVFVLSGDKPVKTMIVKRRRHNSAGQKHQRLIVWKAGKSPIADIKSVWPQYYKEHREKVIAIE